MRVFTAFLTSLIIFLPIVSDLPTRGLTSVEEAEEWTVKVDLYLFRTEKDPYGYSTLPHTYVEVASMGSVARGSSDESGMFSTDFKGYIRVARYEGRISSFHIELNISFRGSWILQVFRVRWDGSLIVSALRASCRDLFERNMSTYAFRGWIQPYQVNETLRTMQVRLDAYLIPARLVKYNGFKYVNPLTGDESLIFLYLVNWAYTDNKDYVLVEENGDYLLTGFEITGNLNRPFKTSEIKLESIRMEVSIYEEVDLTDFFVHHVINYLLERFSMAKSELGGLWSGEDEDRLWVFNQFLSRAERLFKECLYSDGAYLLRECFRIVEILKERVAKETLLDAIITPIVIVVLASFSVLTARLLHPRRARILAIVFFLAALTAFSYTHPYLLMFIATVQGIIFSIPYEVTGIRVIQIASLVVSLTAVAVLIARGGRAGGESNLDQAMRNLRRRRLRTILAIFVVLIVSSASMMHTASISYSIVERKIDAKPAPNVELGAVIYNYTLGYMPAYQEPKGFISSLSLAEAEWLSTVLDGEYSIVGAGLVGLKLDEKASMRVPALTLNLSYALKYLGLNEALTSYRQVDGVRWVILDEALAGYGLSIGDVVEVNGEELVTVGFFNLTKLADLTDIDGMPLIPREFGFPLESVRVLAPSEVVNPEASMIKLSTVARGWDRDKLWSTVVRILNARTDTDTEAVGTESPIVVLRGFTYLIHLVEDGGVREVLSTGYGYVIVGPWAAQIVLSSIGVCMIYVTANASILERRREVEALSSLGAAPTDITMLLAYEGLTLGIVGGALSYTIGYVVAWAFYSVDPSLIVSLPYGLLNLALVTLIAALVSIAGYLIPARSAVKIVIPSGILRRGLGEVLAEDRRSLSIKVPLRLRLDEEAYIGEYLLRVFPTFFPIARTYGLTVFEAAKAKYEEGSEYTYRGSLSFYYETIRHVVTPVTITLTLKHGATYLDARLTINFEYAKPNRKELIDLVSELRYALLRYLDWKTS